MKIVKCKECKENKPHGAKGLCASCYQRALYKKQKMSKNKSETTYYAKNAEKVKGTQRTLYQERKEKQARFNKRIKGALKKAGHSEERIAGFFGIK